MARVDQRREILDWYHLKENLHQVGGSLKRLNQAEAFLWVGKVDETAESSLIRFPVAGNFSRLELFQECQKKQAENFCQYWRKHRHRIVNFNYFQAEQLCSIGSGAVESAIKQIDRRIQISAAQWNAENVPQVLAHRCAYLNGLIGSPT